MSKEVAKQAKQLPAHLANLPGFADETGDEWGSGQASGFPVISTKGKVFHIRRGDVSELVSQADDPDEPATFIPVVILKTHPGTAKTYYAGQYVEGADDKPTCYSNDGIHPAADAQNRQHKNCALCPRNQWGSRITEDGKKAKQCSDVKRLAVVTVGEPTEPMLLRIPPTSLKTWDAYTALLKKRGLTPRHVITKVGFDHTVAHQAITFKPTGYITEEMVEPLSEAMESNTIEAIIGADQSALPPILDDDEEMDAETGEITKKAAKPTKQAAAELDEEDFDLGDDDEEDEDAEAAKAEAEAKAKKAAAAKKRKATLAKKKAAEEKAAAEAAAAEEDDAGDDFDFEDEEDEPPAKANPKTKAKAKAAPEPDDADDDDLDFDDLDFD